MVRPCRWWRDRRAGGSRVHGAFEHSGEVAAAIARPVVGEDAFDDDAVRGEERRGAPRLLLVRR
jgi:hypothetical protein